MQKSCSILSLNCCNLEQFTRDLNRIEEKYQNVKIKTYAELLLLNLRKLKELWDFYYPFHSLYTEIDIVQKKIENDGNLAGWPMTDAVYIWPWLHIIAIDIDLNCGFLEKQAFLNFIPDIIACGNCKNHYMQHKTELVKTLQLTTCANALLALHTYINSNLPDENENITMDSMSKTGFIYKTNLVNLFYSLKYKKDYLILKTNYE